MDSNRFDQLTKRFGQAETRRTLFSRFARGGIATWLAGMGLLALDGESVEAVNCRRRCRRLRRPSTKRRCHRRCRLANQRRRSNRLSTPIGVGPVIIGGACTSNAQCASGNCAGGFCAACPGVRLCGNRCCTVDASCAAGLCVIL